MSDRGVTNNGCGGRGGDARGGRGQGLGQNYTGSINAAKKVLCTNLGNNVFDYDQKYAADQMWTSWEELVQFFSKHYRQDIINELENKIPVILVKPVHTDDVLTKHGVREIMIRSGQ
jgi:hypothetical protein